MSSIVSSLGIFMLLLLSVSNAEANLFGPHVIERGTGKPVSQTHVFAAPAETREGLLRILNGNEGGEARVTSLSLSINGSEIVGPELFNQGVGVVEQPVALAPNNTLSVQVNGAPGSYVTISVWGDDGDVVTTPTASLTVDPDLIEQGQSALLNWDTSGADEVSIEPGLGRVATTGSMIVSPVQTTTYALSARRGADEVVSSVILNVSVQPLTPHASMTLSPDVITAGETATLSWSAQNAATVTLDPGFGSVQHDGTVTVSPSSTTTYTLVAANTIGEQTIQATLQVQPANVTAPIVFDDLEGQLFSNAQVRGNRLTVSGTVVAELGPEIGVTINGALAEVDGQRFIFNHLPLQEGWNSIEIMATDNQGRSVQRVVQVYAETEVPGVVLTADWLNGAVPLANVVRAEMNNGRPIVSADVQCRGPNTVVPQTIDGDSWQLLLEQPGLYVCEVEATDDHGQVYRDRIGMVAWDTAALDGQLQIKWQDMKNAMANTDVDHAVEVFSLRSREAYRAQFTALGQNLPELAARMGAFRLVSVRENRAIYDLRTSRDGQEYSFLVDFIRDEDGLWRVWTF